MAWRLQTLRMLMARGGTEVCRLKYIETCDCSYTFTSYNFMQRLLASTHHPLLEVPTNLREDFMIMITRDADTMDGWLQESLQTNLTVPYDFALVFLLWGYARLS